ncbi:MAG: phosphoribosylanthranilate isomerase, partial [Oscillospiraceae bacterium]|nr:phosphoribosylanthranilate isomerase [Oscillospiraceae bacterium]
MTRIKLCGLTRPCDIEAANALLPEYIGFVFAEKSRRRVTGQDAKALRAGLDPAVQAVGVFVREQPERVAALL